MTPRSLLNAPVLCFSLLWLAACGSSPVPVPTQVPDVYAVGFEPSGSLYKAVLWKNNVPTVLDSGAYGARAFSVAVANGHIYVAGIEGSASGNNIAVLWVDNVPMALTDGTGIGFAGGVAVAGTDVYVVGTETNLNAALGTYVTAAKYWKNGSPTILNSGIQGSGTNAFIGDASATAIAVSGTDIYIAGTVGMQTQTAPNTFTDEPAVTYWKNGVATQITTGLEFAQTSGIAVQGGHVYVSGGQCATFTPNCLTATVWTDGIPASLNPGVLSEASGVAIVGTNVYASVNVTDAIGTTAFFAKDGTGTSLSSTNASAANCVVTYGTDVYVGGAETGSAAYWKNGTVSYLSGAPTGSSVYAMAVVAAP